MRKKYQWIFIMLYFIIFLLLFLLLSKRRVSERFYLFKVPRGEEGEEREILSKVSNKFNYNSYL